jgi:cytochrome c oxidase subunit 2
MMALLLLGSLGCCSAPAPDRALAKAVIARNCSGCHEVRGVSQAVGRVGPSLSRIGSQQVIAGRLPNSRRNLMRWVTHAQAIEPGGVMPDIPLSRRQAAAVADYLYSLDAR